MPQKAHPKSTHVLTSFWKSVDSLCEQRPSNILVWNRGTQIWEPSSIEVWDLSNRKEESGRRRHMSRDVVTRRSLLCLLTVASFCSTLGLFVTSPAHEAIAVLCVRLIGFIVLIAGLLVYSHCAQFETLLQASCNAAFWIYESIFVHALPGVSSQRFLYSEKSDLVNPRWCVIISGVVSPHKLFFG
jgi:hypothetical protein